MGLELTVKKSRHYKKYFHFVLASRSVVCWSYASRYWRQLQQLMIWIGHLVPWCTFMLSSILHLVQSHRISILSPFLSTCKQVCLVVSCLKVINGLSLSTIKLGEQSSRSKWYLTITYNRNNKYDEIEIFLMSKIETSTKKPRVKATLCAMCGLQVRHIAEVNRHSMCTRCFSDYLEDRFGSRRIRIEGNSSKSSNRQASSSRPKNKQTSTGAETALVTW